MNSARSSFSLFLLFLTASLPSLAPAAPPKTAVPSVLSFRLTARVGYSSAGQSSLPDQTVSARVMLRANRARVETTIGGDPSIVLFAPPYLYRFLPSARAGVRWKLPPPQKSVVAGFDPAEFLQNPAKIRAALIQSGAKRVGTSQLNGVAVEIFEAANFRQKGQKARAWLRRSDALPVRFETTGGTLRVVASWSDYARPKKVSAALFAPPAGYKVRDAQGAPPFSVL